MLHLLELLAKNFSLAPRSQRRLPGRWLNPEDQWLESSK
jgi:hypothetical protein